MKRTFSELLFVVIPKFVGGCGTILANLIILRCLGPELFGVYSLCVVSVLLAEGIIGSSFDMGVLRLAPIYRTSSPRRSYTIERSALFVKLSMVAGLSIPLCLLRKPIGQMAFHRVDSAHSIIISCLTAFGLLALRSTLVHLQVDRRFAAYGTTDLLHHSLKFGGIAFVLAFFQPSPGAILLCSGIAAVSVFLLSLGTLSRKLLIRHPEQRGAVRELLKYVKWFFFTFSVTSTVSRLDIMLLTACSAITEVGIFSAGHTFALIPELLGTYLAIIFSPRIMPRFSKGQFSAFFIRYHAVFLVLAVAIYLAFVLTTSFIQAFLLPGDYTRSVEVISILLPGTLATMVCFPLAIPFVLFVRPSFLLKMECVLLPFVLIAYVYAIQDCGAIGAAWVTSVSRVSKGVIIFAIAWWWAGKPPDSAGVESPCDEAILPERA